jgi:hypothetical protein
MAKHASKGKKDMQKPPSELGICIICGEEKMGAPAGPEPPIRAARYLRAALKRPAKHTVACREHLEEAGEKRAKYEKKVRDYGLGAALFFAFMMAGSLLFGRLDLWLILPAFLGAFFVALLPHFYYFPSFQK